MSSLGCGKCAPGQELPCSTCSPLTAPPLISPAQLSPHPCPSQASPSACPSPSASSLSSRPSCHTHTPPSCLGSCLSPSCPCRLPMEFLAPSDFFFSLGWREPCPCHAQSSSFSSCLTPGIPCYRGEQFHPCWAGPWPAGSILELLELAPLVTGEAPGSSSQQPPL